MSAVTEASDRLFEFFCKSVPVPGKQSGNKSLKGLDSALQRFYSEARAQRESMRLGVIGRARVAFGLQQKLLHAGYPPDLVRQVLFAMLVVAFVG